MKDLCTLFFTVLALSLGAQESLSPDQKPPPPPESFSLTPMPDDLWAQMRYDGRPVPNIQDLAVLGWSEEGKIAILTGNHSPFRPDFSATFQIIDLVTDTRRALLGPQSMQDVIEEYGIMGDPLPGNPENPMSLEYFYALNQNKIYRLMIQEGIRPQSGFFGQGALLQEDRDIRFALKVLNKTPPAATWVNPWFIRSLPIRSGQRIGPGDLSFSASDPTIPLTFSALRYWDTFSRPSKIGWR
jgi:hypothetical protein